MNILASLMAAVVIMFAIWQEYDPRAIVVFVICLATSEIFVQIRWRLAVVCRTCGFDPILYVKDPAAASAKVKLQLDRRKEDPKYLLTKSLNLPTISAKKAQALQTKEKGQIVSRSI